MTYGIQLLIVKIEELFLFFLVLDNNDITNYTPYPLAALWKVSGVISISEHRTTATVSKNSRNSASSSALK